MHRAVTTTGADIVGLGSAPTPLIFYESDTISGAQ